MLILVSTKNRGTSGRVQPGGPARRRAPEVRDSLPLTLRMFRVKSDKCDWFRSQSIVFTKPIRTGISLDLPRRPDSWSWCWQKGAAGKVPWIKRRGTSLDSHSETHLISRQKRTKGEPKMSLNETGISTGIRRLRARYRKHFRPTKKIQYILSRFSTSSWRVGKAVRNYSVCMGIQWQIIFSKIEFYITYESKLHSTR